jgi:AcrR family transcriptional regulator
VAAIAELESVRLPFTMTDVAERAGISRATLYRDAGLRDLVGVQGDGPAKRPVGRRDYDTLQEKAEALAQERRVLRRTLRGLEERVQAAELLVDELKAEARAANRERRSSDQPGGDAAERIQKEAYAEGFAAGVRAAAQRGGGPVRGGGSASGELLSVASRLPKATLQAARRTLARQLHPDLFAQDPAAAMLATELLKQINNLVGPGGS